MLIQVRGTSGSGKSTVVNSVMETAGFWDGVLVPGRKRPLYYLHEGDRVIALGHYESPCGGCDTIGSARAVYELVMSLPAGHVVIAEGLLLSEDTKWTRKLAEDGWDVRVLFLTTPLETCLRQIASRRAKAGNDRPLNPGNTTNRVRVIERARVKLLDTSGVLCCRCSARQAPGIVLGWLRPYLEGGVEVGNP